MPVCVARQQSLAVCWVYSLCYKLLLSYFIPRGIRFIKSLSINTQPRRYFTHACAAWKRAIIILLFLTRVYFFFCFVSNNFFFIVDFIFINYNAIYFYTWFVFFFAKYYNNNKSRNNNGSEYDYYGTRLVIKCGTFISRMSRILKWNMHHKNLSLWFHW